jgi:hypothetical protein
MQEMDVGTFFEMSTFQELSQKLDCILAKKRLLQAKHKRAVDDIKELFVKHDVSSGTSERWDKLAFKLYKNVITVEELAEIAKERYLRTDFTKGFHVVMHNAGKDSPDCCSTPDCCSRKETLIVHGKDLSITKEMLPIIGTNWFSLDSLYAQCCNGHVVTIKNIDFLTEGDKLNFVLIANQSILRIQDETLVALRLAKRQDVIDRRVSLLVHDFLYKPVTGFFPRFYAKKDSSEFASYM